MCATAAHQAPCLWATQRSFLIERNQIIMIFEIPLQELSEGDRNKINLAIRMANQSTYPKSRHGSVLSKNGRIISASFNRYGFHSFGRRFSAGSMKPVDTIHAEWGCILGLSKELTNCATIYVVRVNQSNELRMSKPCSVCEKMIRFVGIKRVVFSINENLVGVWRI